MDTIDAYFDGACEPYNPGGHMGMGWVINGLPGNRYIAAGLGNSNNVAEYLALIEILRWAKMQIDATTLHISGDSQLVIFQLNGEYAVRAANLLPLFKEASALIGELKSAGWIISLYWVNRDNNWQADEASIKALTEHNIAPTRRFPDAGWTDKLGNISKEIGISAVALGKLMTSAGLRENNQPSQIAYDTKLAQQRYNGYGICVDWHQANVLAAISVALPEALSMAVNAAEHKQAKADAVLRQREEAENVARQENTRIGLYRSEVERIITAVNCSLYDAVEQVVSDLCDRPAVYSHRRNWYRQRAISGLSTTNPDHRSKISDLENKMSKEYLQLVRRAKAG